MSKSGEHPDLLHHLNCVLVSGTRLVGYGVERFAGENFARVQQTESIEAGNNSGRDDLSKRQ